MAEVRRLVGAPSAKVELAASGAGLRAVVREGEAVLSLGLVRGSDSTWQAGPISLSVAREFAGQRAGVHPNAESWLRALSTYFRGASGDELSTRGSLLADLIAAWQPPADFVPPTPAEADVRLEEILARGSVNLGRGVGTERLMLMLTRSCELRCGYCFVAKTESGPEMHAGTARRAVDLLMLSTLPRLEVQFFGGEPTRRWDVLSATLDYATRHPGRDGRSLAFILTTNGLGLDPERLRVLGQYPVKILFSCDGSEENHRRFRGGHLVDDATAHASILGALERLQVSELDWFMHTVFPPAAAGGVEARYRWARERGIPRLQMAYAIGSAWPGAHVETYAAGIVAALRDHHANPTGLDLFNWRNGCEPLILSDDVTVDVDGTVLHDGAIFLERGFPALRTTYRRGHIEDLTRFDPVRWTLRELHDAILAGYPEGTPERGVIAQNLRMGARMDLTVERLAASLGHDTARGGRAT